MNARPTQTRSLTGFVRRGLMFTFATLLGVGVLRAADPATPVGFDKLASFEFTAPESERGNAK